MSRDQLTRREINENRRQLGMRPLPSKKASLIILLAFPFLLLAGPVLLYSVPGPLLALVFFAIAILLVIWRNPMPWN